MSKRQSQSRKHRRTSNIIHDAAKLLAAEELMGSDDPADRTAGYNLIGDMYGWQVQAAAEYLIERQKTFKKIDVWRKRHKMRTSATLYQVVERAAKAGNEEATSILAGGLLDAPNIEVGAHLIARFARPRKLDEVAQ